MNNVQKGKKYPACWLTGGLHDPRVAYWEPSKFLATLRDANPDNEYPFCMKLDLSAGKSALVFFIIEIHVFNIYLDFLFLLPL